MVNLLDEDLAVEFRVVDGQDVDVVDGSNRKQAAIPVLCVSLEIVPEHRGYFTHVGNRELQIVKDVVNHFDCQSRKE